MNINFKPKNFIIGNDRLIMIPRQSAEQVKRTPYNSIENLNSLIELFYESHKDYIDEIIKIYNGYPLLNTPPIDFKYTAMNLGTIPLDRIVGSILTITDDYYTCMISECYPIDNITDDTCVTCDILTNKNFNQATALHFVLRKGVKLI